MTKRETCKWAIVELTPRRSLCCIPVPVWVERGIKDQVADKDCESCPCWTAKDGPTIGIHCTCCGKDATVGAVLVPANSQKICDSCQRELAAEGKESK